MEDLEAVYKLWTDEHVRQFLFDDKVLSIDEARSFVRFAQTFKQFPSVRMEIENLRVREIAPGAVVTDFNWRVYPMGQGPAFHGVGSGVYLKRDGKWVEVLEHETVTKVDEGLPGGKN